LIVSPRSGDSPRNAPYGGSASNVAHHGLFLISAHAHFKKSTDLHASQCVHTVSNRFFLIRFWITLISPSLEAQPPVKHSGENPRNEELLRDALYSIKLPRSFIGRSKKTLYLKNPQPSSPHENEPIHHSVFNVRCSMFKKTSSTLHLINRIRHPDHQLRIMKYPDHGCPLFTKLPQYIENHAD